MKMVRCLMLVIILSLAMTAWAGEPSLIITDSGFEVRWQVDKNGKFSHLEVKGKNIHLRIYECGKVEKLEWKEINPNETGLGNSSIMLVPGIGSSSLLLPR